jgi:hypothetical protein
MDIDVYVYACVYIYRERERTKKRMNLFVYIPFSYGLPCGEFFTMCLWSKNALRCPSRPTFTSSSHGLPSQCSACSSELHPFPWSQWCWWCNCQNDALKVLTCCNPFKNWDGDHEVISKAWPMLPGTRILLDSLAMNQFRIQRTERNPGWWWSSYFKERGCNCQFMRYFLGWSISMASFPVAQDMIVHPYAYLGVPFQLISGICWNASIFRGLYPIIQWL